MLAKSEANPFKQGGWTIPRPSSLICRLLTHACIVSAKLRGIGL